MPICGKCEKCGYNKSTRALTFHHIREEDKKFSLDSRNILSQKWENILKELDKCQLLCFNCHMEHHQSHTTSKYAEYIKKRYGFNA